MNNHIEYGRIVETRYAINVPDKKSITEYLYKTYKQNEDTEDRFPKSLEGQLNADISLGGTRSFIENMLLTPFSKSALRGKIEKKCYYADDLSPTNKLYEENYYYTTTDSKYIAYPKLALGELYEQRINIENPQLSSVERTYYNDGVPAIYTRTFYEYNDLGQLHSSTVADSKGTDITTAYVYPHEIPHPSDAGNNALGEQYRQYTRLYDQDARRFFSCARCGKSNLFPSASRPGCREGPSYANGDDRAGDTSG